ncbi:MAG: protein-L-isoaspartate O-methyltransferase [Candidatus Micrarchaeaceae archaeon]
MVQRGNAEMVKALVEEGDADEKVARAMLKFDRKDFLPESEKENAYVDVPLPIGDGQTTSAPSIIAFMLKSLELRKGMKVLEVGTGTGYQTALLSDLVGNSGSIISMEISRAIFMFASQNIKAHKISNVKLVNANALVAYKQYAPYNRIIFSAAMKRLDEDVAMALVDGGIMVAPIGDFFGQYLYKITRSGNSLEKEALLPVAFVSILP